MAERKIGVQQRTGVVLDALAKDECYNCVGWAQWLMQKAGPVDTILEVDELTVEGSIFFAGRIVVKGAIKIARWLFAGAGIKAGAGIEAGDDFGIYAGLRVRLSMKSLYALVIAKELPKNLLLGTFRQGDR